MTDATSAPSAAPAPHPATNPVQLARDLLKTLQEQFAVFREFKPLSIGIDKQLIARDPAINRKVLRIALGIHTKSTRYLKEMEKATTRFDLDGNATEEVAEAHRTLASEMLRERFKKIAEQRKAQRENEKAQREQEQAQRRRAEKLDQLAAKFSRK